MENLLKQHKSLSDSFLDNNTEDYFNLTYISNNNGSYTNENTLMNAVKLGFATLKVTIDQFKHTYHYYDNSGQLILFYAHDEYFMANNGLFKLTNYYLTK